jgi:hypothetical protein
MYVSRDPFARTELHRSRVEVNGQTCDWCGGVCERKGKTVLYAYRIESDGGRHSDIRGLFCSASCMRSYGG